MTISLIGTDDQRLMLVESSGVQNIGEKAWENVKTAETNSRNCIEWDSVLNILRIRHEIGYEKTTAQKLGTLSWHRPRKVDIPKTLLRKDPRFKPLHQMLIDYTAKVMPR